MTEPRQLHDTHVVSPRRTQTLDSSSSAFAYLPDSRARDSAQYRDHKLPPKSDKTSGLPSDVVYHHHHHHHTDHRTEAARTTDSAASVTSTPRLQDHYCGSIRSTPDSLPREEEEWEEDVLVSPPHYLRSLKLSDLQSRYANLVMEYERVLHENKAFKFSENIRRLWPWPSLPSFFRDITAEDLADALEPTFKSDVLPAGYQGNTLGAIADAAVSYQQEVKQLRRLQSGNEHRGERFSALEWLEKLLNALEVLRTTLERPSKLKEVLK